jgi:hypothetical protein
LCYHGKIPNAGYFIRKRGLFSLQFGTFKEDHYTGMVLALMKTIWWMASQWQKGKITWWDRKARHMWGSMKTIIIPS